MTARADLDLRSRVLHRIFGRMQRMTACARDIARSVRARSPVVRGIRLVASETLRILSGGGCVRFRTEVDHARERSAACLDVRAAWPMTSLALQTAAAERPSWITRLRMLGTEDAGDRRVVMAAKTTVRSLRAIRSFCVRRPGDWRSSDGCRGGGCIG